MATATTKSSFIEKFLTASGFTESDVLAANEKSRQVVTNAGGKYRLTPKGRVLRLSGPAFPKETTEDN